MFLTTEIWHHTHSMVTSSCTNSKETHAPYDDVLFYANDKLQTEKTDKNKRWTTFTSFLYVAHCDSNASIGVTLGLAFTRTQTAAAAHMTVHNAVHMHAWQVNCQFGTSSKGNLLDWTSKMTLQIHFSKMKCFIFICWFLTFPLT